MSVHNGERFLRDAVLSILGQTYQDFEFLIVDDASADTTPHILRELAIQDARIRILTNQTNLGLTKSLNLALKEARGKYIARMDADDVALRQRLEAQVTYLEMHSDIGVVGTGYEWIDEQGVVIGRPAVITQSNHLRRALPRTNPILHGSAMIRRELLDEVDGYDESYSRAQDYDLWLRLIRRTHFANLPQTLMQRRLAKTMISIANEREQLRCAVRARMNAIHRGDIPAHSLIYILKPLIASIFPQRIVRWTRIHIFGQRHYDHTTLR
jgi:glycosyltransferase involved in cell wall biosynthesis